MAQVPIRQNSFSENSIGTPLRSQYSVYDVSDDCRAYKLQRGINGNIYVLTAPSIPIFKPPLSLSDAAVQGCSHVFAACYD